MARLVAATLATAQLIAPAHAAATVTTYRYNADGAMTAVTTEVDGGAATTEYLTWDNFVPDADDPTTGTAYAGNGNLLAIGPKPNTGNSLFSFDRRDRLTSFRGSDRLATYGYHADGLMASSTAADNSGFGFYYAGSGMTNLRQTDKDLWSARLGPVRYLDDGSEEVLLAPRKDVAALYDPVANAVKSYSYDAFGADDAPLSTGYDLKDNPHRYAGAYRDPLWGGYYLTARWYDPDLATFLSRDPVAGFHPYNYGDGNPVMMVDPTGTSTQTAGHAYKEKGWSIAFNIFVAPFISIFTNEYWNDVAHNRDQAATFLALGIVAELVSGGLDYTALSAAWRGFGRAGRWLSQGGVDVGLNVGQAAVSATHGSNFRGTEFAQNLEGLPMGMFYARFLAGGGMRTHTLRAADVVQKANGLGINEVLVFRARKPGLLTTWSSPAMEGLGIGKYHEAVVQVTNGDYIVNKVEKYGVEGASSRPVLKLGGHSEVPKRFFKSEFKGYKFQYVGKMTGGTIENIPSARHPSVAYSESESSSLGHMADFAFDAAPRNPSPGLLSTRWERWRRVMNNTKLHNDKVIAYLREEHGLMP